MLSIDVAEPEVYGNIEWISVKIHGQSFMLHQIVRSAAKRRNETSLVARDCVTNDCEMTGCPAAKDDKYGCSCDTDKDSGFCRSKDVRSVSTDTCLCESV